jgi:hypothetical protein
MMFGVFCFVASLLAIIKIALKNEWFPPDRRVPV